MIAFALLTCHPLSRPALFRTSIMICHLPLSRHNNDCSICPCCSCFISLPGEGPIFSAVQKRRVATGDKFAIVFLAGVGSMMAGKKALVVLAKGAEEMEAVISIDVLRRAKIDTVVAGLDNVDIVQCSRGVYLKPDTPLEEAKKDKYDAVVLPGGLEGANNLAASPVVKDILRSHEKDGKVVAAICAGPLAFVSHGIGKGKQLTSHPSVKDRFEGYDYQEQVVVQDGNMITSRGPGTAFDFALKVVEALCGEETVTEMKKPMLLN